MSKQLQPHQQRVVDEKAALDTKRDALDAFAKGATYKSLPRPDQELLDRQVGVMRNYSLILGERIARFN